MIELLCRRRVPWEREATENHFCEVNKTLVNGVTDEISSSVHFYFQVWISSWFSVMFSMVSRKEYSFREKR